MSVAAFWTAAKVRGAMRTLRFCFGRRRSPDGALGSRLRKNYRRRQPDYGRILARPLARVPTASDAVTFTPSGGIWMQQTPKQEWVAPKVQRYGTFESATQYCDKKYGVADGFTMEGQAIVCAS